MAKEIKNENAEAVVEAVSKTEQFFTKNGKSLTIFTVSILAICAVVFCWHRFVYQPEVDEAQGQMAYAEEAFRTADYETALNGDGNTLGFAQIIDEYGSKAGKAVYFYGGVCELQLGNFEQAIKYLEAYNGKDAILAARATACIGDAYIGLEDYGKALGYFVKAAETVDNMYAAGYLLKAGITAEKLGEDEKALSFYKKIKDQYPQSMQGYDIDKYIGRITNK
ncbi:MAG: tetratricopeptide repeat protein [Bacteroidales bacterium]|nr:tetratricopeptide repeat protein [Bacteroidales bacterium]